MSNTALLNKDNIMTTSVETKYSLILGSASPRRKKLLKYLGQAFTTIPANIDESKNEVESPREYAHRLAQEKALKIASNHGQTSIIIGGDTVVALGNEVLGKPNSVEEARETLQKLSNQEHQVLSGWAIVQQDSQGVRVLDSGVCESTVCMRSINEQEIMEYIASGEPMDKAGSYGIQGLGGRFVNRAIGSFFSIIGLPLIDLYRAMLNLDLLHDPNGLIIRGIELRERVAFAAWRSGRSVDAVDVLAVSKFHNLSSIKQANQCDFNHFGESYVQELMEKKQELTTESLERAQDPESTILLKNITWHYIGGIQSNKAKKIGSHSRWVHGLSRLSEAKKLAQGAEDQGIQLKVFIQVNLADEQSKGGIQEDELRGLLEACKDLVAIEVVGLMTFPPLDEPENNRIYFRKLRILRDQLELEGFVLPHLSMGTSDDFEIAIEEGSTWVRLGRSLFGERS